MDRSNKCVLSVHADGSTIFACKDVTNECEYGLYSKKSSLYDRCKFFVNNQCENPQAITEVSVNLAHTLTEVPKEKK